MATMGWGDFFIVLVCCSITMLVCRVVPLFVLKGKELPQGVEQALGFIPPAAFAALVANDLLTPGMFDAGLCRPPRRSWPRSWWRRWRGRRSRFCGAPSRAWPHTRCSRSYSVETGRGRPPDSVVCVESPSF